MMEILLPLLLFALIIASPFLLYKAIIAIIREIKKKEP